uniref:Uncharacterized protein n=1 Tax=Panagrolaimus sp. JU765 TaxID=591449 RepID=A0AC34PZ27_9BILA
MSDKPKEDEQGPSDDLHETHDPEAAALESDKKRHKRRLMAEEEKEDGPVVSIDDRDTEEANDDPKCPEADEGEDDTCCADSDDDVPDRNSS